jgi:putative transposase
MSTPQKGYKYRLYPNREQRAFLNRSFGCKRFVYNALLEQSQTAYALLQENPTLPKYGTRGYDFAARLPALKQAHAFLGEVSSVVLQQAALDLGGAYQSFFRGLKQGPKRGFPQFKKKRHRQSIRLVGTAFSVQEGQFHIAKCANPIKVKWSRALPSAPSSVTLSKTPDGAYYASFVCEYIPAPTNGDEAIGLDLGIKAFYADSNGAVVNAPKPLKRAEGKLKRLQRALSRKQKGSSNRHKARLNIAKLHARITQQRRDVQHKLSRALINRCRVIGIEDLNVSGMLRNHCLAKAVNDQSWAQFVEFLRYKAVESHWCTVVKIDRWFASTQTCSACGTALKGRDKLRLSQRHWTCAVCGTAHDRDTNAAVNILQEAFRVLERMGHGGQGAFVLAKQECL